MNLRVEVLCICIKIFSSFTADAIFEPPEPRDGILPEGIVVPGFSIIIILLLDFLFVSIFTSFFDGDIIDDKSTSLEPFLKSGSYLSTVASVVVGEVTL